jgi:ABC-2 type transport system permease protein
MKKCFAIHPLFAAQIEVLLVTCLKSWRSYPAIGRISMRARTAYRFDVWMGATLPFLRVLLAFLLWRVLFTSRSEIAGFTLEGMTAYYILTAFLSRLDQSGGLVWEYADDIREGRFAKYLTKPLNPFGHFLATSAARSLYVGGVALASVFLLALLFGNRRLFTSSWQNALMAGVIALLGLIFLACLNWLTAILAWKFKDITGFHLIKGNLVEFLAGTLFPLSLLPEPVVFVLKWLPFYHLHYLPASLFLGRRQDEALSSLLILLGWTLGILVVGEISWRRLRRHDEGVGA